MRALVVLPTPRTPGEEERVGDAVLRDGVRERPRDVLLADQLFEDCGRYLRARTR